MDGAVDSLRVPSRWRRLLYCIAVIIRTCRTYAGPYIYPVYLSHILFGESRRLSACCSVCTLGQSCKPRFYASAEKRRCVEKQSVTPIEDLSGIVCPSPPLAVCAMERAIPWSGRGVQLFPRRGEKPRANAIPAKDRTSLSARGTLPINVYH